MNFKKWFKRKKQLEILIPYGNINDIEILSVSENYDLDILEVEDKFVIYEHKSIKALSNLKNSVKSKVVKNY